MKAIRPYLDKNDPTANPLGLTMPSQDATLNSQSVDWQPGGSVTASQTWIEPDGTEFELELIVDNDMQAGHVMSCRKTSLSSGFGGVMAMSGYLGPMPSFRSGSGRYGNIDASGVSAMPSPPKKEVTLMEAQTGKKKADVKGMDYDLSGTGIMKKKADIDGKDTDGGK